jgi:hypothetical protein
MTDIELEPVVEFKQPQKSNGVSNEINVDDKTNPTTINLNSEEIEEMKDSFDVKPATNKSINT